jgi:hypothetical protein
MKELKKRDKKRSFRQLCEGPDLPYGNFMRWKGRMDRGEEPVHPAGPKKIEPLDSEALRNEVEALRHGQKRTAGTGVFYVMHKDHISRRQVQVLVDAVRRELNHDKQAEMRRISWTVPGIVWAIDDTEFRTKVWGWHAFVNQIHVLGARYDLEPCAGESILPGTEVAVRLEKQFEEYGAPLILKRDGGSNLNHADVNLVLSEYHVIPLNSPTYYPPYNGAIERSQRELKEGMAERGMMGRNPPLEFIQLSAENVVYKLNHKERRVLDGQIACVAFSVGTQNSKAYNRRQRREIYDRLVAMATETLAKLGKTGHRVEQAAWRMAIEAWLQESKQITVTQNGKVLPYFPEFWTHN